MNLKLACADFTFPLLDHDHVLDLIARLGVQGVDVGLFHERETHLKLDAVCSDVAAHARALSHKLDDRGLQLADVYFIPSPDFKGRAANHPDAAQRRASRELFQKMLEFTARCNAKHLSSVPGVRWEQESEEDSIQRSSEELAWRAGEARRCGVTFSIEPHLGSVITTPEATLQLLRQSPGLTLTLDYGHFTAQGIPDSQVEPLVAHASHFHARCACKGRLQAPLKENTIDFAKVLGAMARSKYEGYLGLEYVWIDWQRCNDVDNVSETILLRDHLKKLAS